MAIDISANEVAGEGNQSSVGVRDKDAIIQKNKGLETLEKVPVMQTVVSNKTSTFDFFFLFYIHD